MLCDLFMHRLEGMIISCHDFDVDRDVDAQVGDGAIVPYEPYVYDGNALVSAACEAAQALSSAVPQPIGVQHASHVFFQVLKGRLHQRFSMLHDDHKQWLLAVARLHLCGKAGASGVFRSSGRVEHIDLKALLQRRSVQQLFTDMYVWQTTQSSWLRLLDLSCISHSVHYQSPIFSMDGDVGLAFGDKQSNGLYSGTTVGPQVGAHHGVEGSRLAARRG